MPAQERLPSREVTVWSFRLRACAGAAVDVGLGAWRRGWYSVLPPEVKGEETVVLVGWDLDLAEGDRLRSILPGMELDEADFRSGW